MEVFISKEEQEREKHLFTPHQTAYLLKGKRFVLALYKDTDSPEVAGVQAPLSC